jgi:hypothetical protein
MTVLAFVVIPTLVLACILAPVLLSMGEGGSSGTDTGGNPPPNNDDPSPPPAQGDSATVPLSAVVVDTARRPQKRSS